MVAPEPSAIERFAMKKFFTRVLIFILVVPAAHITLAIVAIFELERGRTATVSRWWATINHITAFPSFYTDLANRADPSVGSLLFVNAAIFSVLRRFAGNAGWAAARPPLLS